MARTQLSHIALDEVIVNDVTVPLLKGTSNYDAWRAKFEEAVKEADPMSWRILNGDQTDPADEIETILSDRSIARKGAAKHLMVGTQSVTEAQLQEFLNGLRVHMQPTQSNFAVTLGWAWREKISSAQRLMESTLSENIQIPCDVQDYLGWARETFFSTGYLAQADAWERWLELRHDNDCEYDHASRRAFIRKFKRIQNQLEEKIGRPIPLEAEMCQFITALQKQPIVQAKFAELVAEWEAPIDIKEIYAEFASFDEGDIEEW